METIAGRTVVVGSVLGEGGFAKVYAAHDPTTGREYVIKRMNASGESMEQVQREVALSERLDHPNIVKVYGHLARRASHSGMTISLLMECCPGGNVFTICSERKGRPLAGSTILRMFLAVCRSVAYLHAQDPPIAHRDIKLENVLVAADGAFKLCDFGSVSTRSGCVTSKRERVDEEDIIQRFTTPVYRAPEMVDLYAGLPIDHRVDIWALGCFLFTLCFYKHPFETAGNLGILSAKYRIPDTPEIPPEFRTIITSCIQIDPADRPSALTLVDYVEGLSRGVATADLPVLFTPKPESAPATSRGRKSSGSGGGGAGRPRRTSTSSNPDVPKVVAAAAPSAVLQRRLALRGRAAAASSGGGGFAPPPDVISAPRRTSSDVGGVADSMDLLAIGGGTTAPAPVPAPVPAPASSSDWGNFDADAFGDVFGGGGGGGGESSGGGGGGGGSSDLLGLSAPIAASSAPLPPPVPAPAPAPVAAPQGWDAFGSSAAPAPAPASSDPFGNADAWGDDPFG